MTASDLADVLTRIAACLREHPELAATSVTAQANDRTVDIHAPNRPGVDAWAKHLGVGVTTLRYDGGEHHTANGRLDDLTVHVFAFSIAVDES